MSKGKKNASIQEGKQVSVLDDKKYITNAEKKKLWRARIMSAYFASAKKQNGARMIITKGKHPPGSYVLPVTDTDNRTDKDNEKRNGESNKDRDES